MTKRSKIESVARESASIPEDQLSCLRACFPEAFTEGKVDMEKLQDTLGGIVETSPERYSFTWAGKKDAIRILQTPSRATLIPAEKESVNFDTAQNLFIEGDNLEALKLLYKSYFGRVKMIYIDPPYNTGNDFIYPDNYADPLDVYLKISGQKDEDGNLLTSNPDTNGRYHSAWLSMMYPRLFLARQLLKEDGAIFVSIDDTELPNLRLVMNEIFGEENFVASFVWVGGRKNDSNLVSNSHEYIVVYAKSVGHLRDSDIQWRERKEGIDNIYKAYEKFKKEHGDKWMQVSLALQEWYKGLKDHDPAKKHAHYRWADAKGVYFASDMSGPDDGRKSRPRYEVLHPVSKKPVPVPARGWRWEWATMEKALADDRVHFGADETSVPNIKVYLKDNEYEAPDSVFYKDRRSSSSVVKGLFSAKVFDFPKDHDVLKRLVGLLCNDGDIVVDFFAGSCSAAHAILESNKTKGTNIRFVMVQLPEKVDSDSSAGKEGFRTIADIGKERIRRAIKNLDSEEGFKVFKLAESNYCPWTGTEERDPEALAKQMEAFNDPLVEGWKPENVLYEVAIKEGFGLNIQTEHIESVKGQEVHRVTDPDREQSFYLCLDDKLNIDTLAPLKLTQDDLFICRDIALDDTAAANLALQCRLKTI